MFTITDWLGLIFFVLCLIAGPIGWALLFGVGLIWLIVWAWRWAWKPLPPRRRP